MIIRVKKDADHPYVMIATEMLKDSSLSLKAKGLLCFLLSKPDDWQIYVRQLAGNLQESKNTIANILNELIGKGYCKRERRHDKAKGTFSGYDYTVYESPCPKNRDMVPCPKSPETGHRSLLINDLKSKNKKCPECGKEYQGSWCRSCNWSE